MQAAAVVALETNDVRVTREIPAVERDTQPRLEEDGGAAGRKLPSGRRDLVVVAISRVVRALTHKISRCVSLTCGRFDLRFEFGARSRQQRHDRLWRHTVVGQES